MRSNKGIIIGLGLLTLAVILHTVPARSSTPTDLAAMVEAVSQTTPTPAEGVPLGATLYSAQHPNWPPYPGNAFNLPAWNLGDNVYLLDDLDFDYDAPTGSARGMSANGISPPGFDEEGEGGDYTNTYTSSFSIDTNLLWLEITNVSGGTVHANLHMATNQVYAIWQTTNLFTSWQVEVELWPTGDETNTMPFTLPTLNREPLFLRAEDWTGVETNGLPCWWLWKYFHALDLSATNRDGQGKTFLYDFQHGLDPNKIFFGLQVASFQINNSTPTVTVDVRAGRPHYYAVLINDEAIPTWLPFSTTNLTVNLGSTNGLYEVTVGMKGYADDATETWQTTQFVLNTTAPVLVITNPTTNVVAQATVQLQGYAFGNLRRLSFDVSNATGLKTNQTGYFVTEFPDLPASLDVTNTFECPDIALVEGTNLITLHATDVANNTTNLSLSLAYVRGTNAPALRVLWPTAGTRISGSQFTLEGQVDNQASTIAAVIVDGGGNTNTVQGLVERSGRLWVPNLPIGSGTNRLTLTATDASGHSSSTNLAVSRSGVTVTVAALTSDQLNQSFVSVTGTSSDPAATVSVNGVEAYYVDGAGNWQADGVPVSPMGTAVFDVAVYTAGSSVAESQHLTVAQPVMVTAKSYHFHETSSRPGDQFRWSEEAVDWLYGFGGSASRIGYDSPPITAVTSAYANSTSIGPELEDLGLIYWASANVDVAIEDGRRYAYQTQTRVMIVPSGQPAAGPTNVYLVRARMLEYPDPEDNLQLPLSPEAFQIHGQALQNSGVTNEDGSVWGETVITAPAGENVDVTPEFIEPPTYWDYTFDVQVTELNLQLAVDNNRDGDVTFDSADQTATEKPFRFWVNNDHDGYDSDIADYADLNPSGGSDADSLYITSSRDLEDFTRLWINTQGITEELQNGTFLLALEWKDTTDDPQLQFFQAAETNGGALYLTDTNVAAQQVSSYGFHIIEYNHRNVLDKYNPFIFPTNFWSNISTNQPVAHLLFDAVSRGSGQLVVSIYKNDGTTKLAEGPPLYLKLQDVKEMYERYTVGSDPDAAPATTASLLTSPYSYDSTIPAENNYILFVHGWNMEQWAKDAFAETAFKRLYWQGYKGRFGAFYWPTTYGVSGTVSAIIDSGSFDAGELRGWQSGTGLKNLLTGLNSQYPGHVYLMAHSQGNIVAGEALRLATNQVVNTYVAMQAAVATHAYDPNATSRALNSTGVNLDSGTSNRYAIYYTPGATNYFNSMAGAGTCVNFQNISDWALNILWEPDQDLKWDQNYTVWTTNGVDNYAYLAGPFSVQNLSFPQDTYEIFSHAVEARCHALGSQPDVAGAFKKDGTLQQVNLSIAPYGLGGEHKDHSGEFNSDNMRRAAFWKAVLNKMKLQEE